MMRFGSSALVTSFLLTAAAMAQDQKPSSSTIGDISNNQGIVTQGQIDTNTVINPIRRDPNSFYQGNEKIGSAMGPVVDAKAGIVSFQLASFTASPDHAKPLEFRDLLLSADGIRRLQGMQMVIEGFQAKIIGRR